MTRSDKPTEARSAAEAQETANVQLTAQLVARIERIPSSPFHLKARVIVGTATFFDAFDAMTVSYILPVLVGLWKLKPGAIGNMISSGYIGQILGAVFFGWLAERKGRMVALRLSVLIMSVFSLACAFAWDYNSLFTFRLIQGLGLGGEVPVAGAYINEIFKAKGRGRFVVLYEYLFVIGVFIASLLGYLMVPLLGWQSMFVLGAVPAVAVIFMQRSLPESPRWLAIHGRLEEAEKTVAIIEASASRGGKVQLPPIVPGVSMATKKTDVRELFKDRYLRRTLTVWVLWFGSYLLTNGLSPWLPTLWVSVYHLSLKDALFWAMGTRFVILITCLVIALYFDVVGRKVWFTGGLLGGAAFLLALWLMIFPTPFFTVWTMTTIAQLCVSLLNVALWAYNPELYPTRLRALGTSISTAWMRLASAIGPALTGYVMAAYSLNAVWLVFGVVVLISGIITWLFAVETRNRVLEEVSP